MAVTPVFHGTVTDDAQLVLSEDEKSARKQHLRSLVGKDVDITIKVHRNKRSLDQNAWEWGIAIPLIAEALGYDRDEREEHEKIHYALVLMCFGTEWDEKLKQEIPKVRSSQLNTKEFSEYMEWLVRWAAREHGVVIPLPSEAEIVQ